MVFIHTNNNHKEGLSHHRSIEIVTSSQLACRGGVSSILLRVVLWRLSESEMYQQMKRGSECNLQYSVTKDNL